MSAGRTPPVAGTRGVVATGHAVASGVAAHVLQAGGSAADAVVAAATTLWVVQPNQSGPGGDAFAVVKTNGEEPRAVLGAGTAPQSLDPATFRAEGATELPLRGPVSAGVPGEVDALRLLWERWGSGKFSWRQLVEPAATRAAEGVVLSRTVAGWYAESAHILAEDPSTREVFLPGGRSPCFGDVVRFPALAESLAALAEEGARELYDGALAERVAAGCQAAGGALSASDLRNFEAEVVEPLQVSWRGSTIYAPPPPSQSVILLEALGILDGDDLLEAPPSDAIHLMVEAFKLAVADRLECVGDPRFTDDRSGELLAAEFCERRRGAISSTSSDRALGSTIGSHTTYLCVADSEGTVVSYIASLSNSFGSARVAGDTGILLNNRVGRGFVLEPGHPNELSPGKRTMSTLIPALVTHGERTCAIGTPGGDRQAQWILQALAAIPDLESATSVELSDVCEAPRWQVRPATDPHTLQQPTTLTLESGFDDLTVESLEERGHRIEVIAPRSGGGGLQIIAGEPGRWWAASDPRVDGVVVPV